MAYPVKCAACDGEGVVEGDIVCPVCNGDGKIYDDDIDYSKDDED